MKGWSSLVVTGIFFCFLTGCATHQAKRDLIILLPDPDGKVGSVTVTTHAGSQVVDKAGYGIVIEDPSKAPAASKPMSEDEIKKVFGSALSIQQDLSNRFLLFILYFEHDKTKLIPESHAQLSEILNHIKGRKSNEIYIVGHTDLVGTEEYNIELSSKRARYVRDLLVSNGITPSSLSVSYFGKSRPLVATGDEIPEPRNRRVEVIIR